MSVPVLRPATPSDSAFIAWAMDAASDGLFPLIFGPRTPEIHATVIAQPSHSFSYSHAVIAELDGAPVGVCQGSPHGTPDGISAILRECWWLEAARAGAFVTVGGRLFTALGRREPGQWYMESLAVLPQARGNGVGSLLFADAFDRARRDGCSALALDVDVQNSRAADLYRRLGLEVVETSEKPLLWGVRNPDASGLRVHRMVTKLDGPES